MGLDVHLHAQAFLYKSGHKHHLSSKESAALRVYISHLSICKGLSCLRALVSPSFYPLSRGAAYHDIAMCADADMPQRWGADGSFQKLEVLEAFDNNLTGSLPEGLALLPALQQLSLSNNSLSGSIPGVWGTPGSFPQLRGMFLIGNHLTGSLKADWVAPGSFPKLEVLQLTSNRFSGTLPDEWAGNGSFTNLQLLALAGNKLSGSLPAAWAAPAAFPQLQKLLLSSNRFAGGALFCMYDTVRG